MRDPHLALALLGVATGGLTVGFGRKGGVLLGAIALAVIVGAVLPTPDAGRGEPLLALAWGLIIIAAGSLWLPDRLRPHALNLVIAIVSGGTAGLLGRVAGVGTLGWFAVALTFSTVVSILLARKRSRLPIRVVAGWLVAIGALNATLTILPVTPGYLPDHLE
ncbi:MULTISPECIES: hypothetical protein [unclassified Sphingomonas]|uniref:hypothetical protein n=1 Tax=unclassified Sphingomonas TaxID=196159 RepID=UPI00092B38FF|nr:MULTISPECIES: hypothetical protein [unclassified Sphingomonas]OJU20401.1 MAG: hypothetical protein BGN95_04790 [Sphingomonas sp. 66-10]